MQTHDSLEVDSREVLTHAGIIEARGRTAAAPRRLGTAVVGEDATVSAADLVTLHMEVIDAAIGFVCRKQRLSHDEAQELASMAYLKLLKDDGAVLRKYRGDSQLGTFLTTVIQRLLIDARIARTGKWRPSARARRLGCLAARLERLIFRDGMHLQEAGTLIRLEFGVTHTDDELDFLITLLPARWRRRFVGEHELERLTTSFPNAEEALVSRDDGRQLSQLARALSALDGDDRLLIKMRFEDGLRPCQIARLQHLDGKAIYRRFDKMLKQLRAAMERQRRMA